METSVDDASALNATAARSQSKGERFSKFMNRVFKRGVDILAAFFGLLLLSPLFLLLPILIRRDSPGPVFFHGLRAGKDGKVFRVLKIRTMRESPESYTGPRITARDDRRITRFGRWLRDSKLNELPQLWNVLKGQMSLVGPRPEDPGIVASWPEEVRREILSIRPGITSPASVIYRREEESLRAQNVLDEYLRRILPDKLRLDRLYVHHHTFLSDLDVIFWTMIALFPAQGERFIPEGQLFSGPMYNFVRRYVSWFAMDSVVAFGAITLTGLIWRSQGPLELGPGLALSVAILSAILFGVVNSLLGLGRVSWQVASATHAFDIALSSALTTVMLSATDWYWPSGPFLPLGLLWVTGLLAFMGFLALRYRQRLLTGLLSRWFQARGQVASPYGERILLVGAGEQAQLVAWLLKRSRFAKALALVGMVDDNPYKQGMIVDGLPVLGATRDIPSLVRKKDIGLILFTISNIRPAERARILDICSQTAARVSIMPDFYQQLYDQLFNGASQ